LSQGEIIAMVPHWVGLVGLVMMLLFCGSFLAQVPFLAMIFLLLGVAMVVLENRYERGTMRR